MSTTFTLRTPPHIKSCHVTGSWDGYGKRYQMNVDKAAGPGYWTLTLKFGASLPPSRYFYYFILDGYFESHDPNQMTIVEPTRKLTLNILDYGTPYSPASSTVSSRRSSPTSSTSSKRSGGVYDLPSPLECDQPYLFSGEMSSGRIQSSTRQQSTLLHIVHPTPRNPVATHKLTLNTNYYSSRAVSPAPSERSSSSCSSYSSGSSPTTPIYDSDSDSEYYYSPVAKQVDTDLAYRLERVLNM